MTSATQTIRIGAELLSQARKRTSAAAVRRDVYREFRFLLCGDPGLISQMRATLLEDVPDGPSMQAAAASVETLSPMHGDTRTGNDIKCIIFLGYPSDEGAALEYLRDYNCPVLALCVDSEAPHPGAIASPQKRRIERVRVAGLDYEALRGRIFPFLVEACHGVEVALGRRLPILRETVCTVLSRAAARTALQITAAGAVVEQVPFIGMLVGTVTSAGDIVAISAIQMNLVMKIGAVFDREPDLISAWELLPIIGGGLGWRVVARELAGFVPVAGVVIKGSIAYAGTVVVGEGALFYYRQGRFMSATQAKQLYDETKQAARELVRDAFDRFRSK